MIKREKLNEIIQTRRKPITILIIILIVILIIGMAITSSISYEEEDLIAVAQADNYIVRINDLINFSSEESKGNIKSVAWNFSDGYESDEPNPTHLFENSGWFEVILLITGPNGRTDNTSIIIGVQNLDRTAVRDVGRWFVLDPSRSSGPANSVVVGPNIAKPSVDISIDLDRPFGTFIFIIDVTLWDAGEVRQQIDIYSETTTLTGGSYQFAYTVNPTELPDEVSDVYALVSATAQIDEGKCQGAVFTLTSIFPIDIPD